MFLNVCYAIDGVTLFSSSREQKSDRTVSALRLNDEGLIERCLTWLPRLSREVGSGQEPHTLCPVELC